MLTLGHRSHFSAAGITGDGSALKSRIKHGIRAGRYRIIRSYCACRYRRRVYGLPRHRERGERSRHIIHRKTLPPKVSREGVKRAHVRTPKKVAALYRHFLTSDKVTLNVRHPCYDSAGFFCNITLLRYPFFAPH